MNPLLDVCDAGAFVVSGSEECRQMLGDMRRGDRLAVGVDRPLARRLLGFRSGTALSTRKTRRELGTRNLRVVARFAVWPSSQDPRLIHRSTLMAWHLQRAGIIGGGGSSFRRQRMARSILAAPIVAICHPSEVWVVEP